MSSFRVGAGLGIGALLAAGVLVLGGPTGRDRADRALQGVASGLRRPPAGAAPARGRLDGDARTRPERAAPAAREAEAFASSAPALWELSDDSAFRFDWPVGSYHPERHALRLAPERLRELTVGDRFQLPLPGMGSVVATVEHVETTALGNLSISGSLVGFDDAYSVTLTQGGRSLFGRVTTPDGNYLIEGLGAAGAIHLDDLDRLIDPGGTDERVPPSPGESPA